MSDGAAQNDAAVLPGASRELGGAQEAGGWAMRWQIPLFLLSLASWGMFLWLGHREEAAKVDEPRDSAHRIIRAFEGRDFEKVDREADVFLQVYPKYERQGELQLLAGRAAFILGETTPERAELYFNKACTSIRRALELGIPDNQTLTARETLARSYLRLGDDRKALDELREVRRLLPGETAHLTLLQAAAEFRLGEDDAGCATVESFLRTPGLSEDRKVDALMTLAEGTRLNGRLDEAERNFRRVIAEYPLSARIKEAHFGLGLTLRAKSEKKAEFIDEARAEFEKVLSLRFLLNEELDRKAGFYAGECLYEKQDFDAATEALRKVAVSYGGTPEGMAAGLRLALILVEQNKFDAAREALAGVLAQVPEDGRLVNKYVTPAEINAVFQAVLKHFLSTGEYGEVEKFNRDTQKVAGRDLYFYQQASLYRHHAQELRDAAVTLRRQGLLREAAEKEQEARHNYKSAGALLVRVINAVDSDPDVYSAALQICADSLYEAGDYAESIVYYRLLLSSTGVHKDIQATRLQYAKALQALGRHREAAAELEVCVGSYGTGPSYYEAKLARAESFTAMGSFDNAERALDEIVCRPDLFSPTGRIWRTALAELGYVLYRESKFKRAVEKLDEILTRPGVLDYSRFSRTQITYYLADSWRNMASSEASVRREELAMAAKYFADVRAQSAETPASALDALMVRRSFVAEADCLYEMGDYRAALALYEQSAERYLDSAEGVGSLHGVAACLHKLGEREKALEAVKRARWSLDKLKRKNAGEVTPFMEDSWNAMIGWSVAGGDQ